MMAFRASSAEWMEYSELVSGFCGVDGGGEIFCFGGVVVCLGDVFVESPPKICFEAEN